MEDILGPSKDFAAAFDSASERLQGVVGEACGEARTFPLGVAAAIRSALDFAAADPDAARALTVDAFAYGVYGAMRYRHMVSHFATLLVPGRELLPDGVVLPEITEEALIGSLAEVVGERMRSGHAELLPALASGLTEFVLGSYLGPDEARRIAAWFGADG